jgi:ketosteroid isomerase-like protein
MQPISPDQVRTEVRRFWDTFKRKSQADFESMYLPDATVFASTVPRSEPARLTVARRMRQFFGPKSKIEIDLGSIDVQLIDNIAIASYSYSFRGAEVRNDGTSVDHEVPAGRGTQIFQLDGQNKLRILHEHFSSCEAPKADTTVEI